MQNKGNIENKLLQEFIVSKSPGHCLFFRQGPDFICGVIERGDRIYIKKLTVILTIVIAGFSLLFAAVSLAENKAGESIFKYKKELSITDIQEKNLRGILSKLQDYLTAKTGELNVLRAELSKMIVEKADLNMIKAKLQTMASIQADASYEDIASLRAIEKELTAAQMSKWRGIQEEFRKNLQDQQVAAPEKMDMKK